MSRKPPGNIAASVRQRLLNIIAETGDDANVVWTRFAIERLLYRISKSEFSGDFILKGAALLGAWSNEPYRPTMDLDLLDLGEDSPERIFRIFRRLCEMPVDSDGLSFAEESIRVTEIRESGDYHGRRVNLVARLGNARIPVQVDIGFGDVVTPKAESVDYPTLLAMPAPRVLASTKQTVVAEKFQAMVFLGIANSRMKDFYDLYKLATTFLFDGKLLAQAIQATFRRRKTPVPIEAPIALTDEFFNAAAKQKQWKAFMQRIDGDAVLALPLVIEMLSEFLLPVLAALSKQEEIGIWRIGGPWEPPKTTTQTRN